MGKRRWSAELRSLLKMCSKEKTGDSRVLESTTKLHLSLRYFGKERRLMRRGILEARLRLLDRLNYCMALGI
jgi:hypothetical protein